MYPHHKMFTVLEIAWRNNQKKRTLIVKFWNLRGLKNMYGCESWTVKKAEH